MAVINFQVRADYMNSTRIHYLIKMIASNGHVISVNCSSVVLVSQPQRLIDKIFKASIPFLIGTFMILMGILLDLEILKEIFLQPIPVVIGFVCQYTLMPLIAYGITKIFKYPPLYGLGLFVVGCCPGGAVSNQWTVMFDGDLNLSAFMSFASTVAAFFMMPFWFYTLGQYAYLRRMKIHIPFLSLALSLLRVIVPLGVGMILVYFIPKLKLITKRIIKPALFLLISYFLVFGSIVNIYLFQYVDLKIALTAPLLPWFGYILGGIAAWLLKQDWKRVKTIGIETGMKFQFEISKKKNFCFFPGIQNIGVAFMVLLYSFPAPQNTQATVVPLIVAYLTAQPFYIVLLCRVIRRKCFNKKTIEEKISADKSSETTRHSSDSEEVDKTTKVPLSSTSIDTKPTEI